MVIGHAQTFDHGWSVQADMAQEILQIHSHQSNSK